MVYAEHLIVFGCTIKGSACIGQYSGLHNIWQGVIDNLGSQWQKLDTVPLTGAAAAGAQVQECCRCNLGLAFDPELGRF